MTVELSGAPHNETNQPSVKAATATSPDLVAWLGAASSPGG